MFKTLRKWKVMRINEICNVETGTTPNTKIKEYWKNGSIKWITPKDLSKLNGKMTIKETERKITKQGLIKSSLRLIPKGSIIISSRAPIGYIAILEDDMTFNQGCKGLVIKNHQIVGSSYLAYQLFTQVDRMQSLGTGSTFKEISKSAIGNLSIPLPPILEQKKIAEILSTVDKAIEKVDESKAKTERFKKGLMQELLTKGIGHKAFKDAEIGRIPKRWEVVKLEKVVDINKESRDPGKEFPEREFLYIDIDSIENETGAIGSPQTIIGRKAPSRARRVIHYNDVIMSTVRPYLKAFAVLPKGYDNQICSTGFAALSCGEEILPSYLLYTLFSHSVISQCNRMMVGGQYPALNNSQVKEIKLPLPPILEQKKIAEILSTVDKRLELLKEKKEKLVRVKKGLMNDLLTGKNRVRA